MGGLAALLLAERERQRERDRIDAEQEPAGHRFAPRQPIAPHPCGDTERETHQSPRAYSVVHRPRLGREQDEQGVSQPGVEAEAEHDECARHAPVDRC